MLILVQPLQAQTQEDGQVYVTQGYQQIGPGWMPEVGL